MNEELIKPVVKKVCKHCGTEDNLIVDRRGYIWSICKECNSKNKSISQLGEKNHQFGKTNSLSARKKISESNTGKKRSIDHCKKQSDRMKGENNPMFGKKASDATRILISNVHKGRKHSEDHCKKNGEAHKATFIYYNTKYTWLSLFEEMREDPEGKSAQFRCKKCNKWFIPTSNSIYARISSLQDNKDNYYLYCSDECKHSCPLFGLHPDYYINSLNKNTDENIDRSELNICRQEVLNRQLKIEWYNHCEICYSTKDLNVHHEKPQKTHPHLALDPDNGIILCGTCHYKFGHINECSTGALAQMICTPIINKEVENG